MVLDGNGLISITICVKFIKRALQRVNYYVLTSRKS